MKKISKLISLGLAFTLSLSLVLTGCGSSSSSKDAGTDSNSAVKKIKSKGVLKAGVKVDVPKFGYRDPKTSKIDGFEIDIVRAASKKIFGDETKIELEPVTAKTRGPLLDSGDVDVVVATFTITDERKKSYNFSNPYFQDGLKLMVKKDAGINEFKNLDGKTIGVAQSATSKKALQDKADTEGIKLKFLEFATYPEIKAALDSKRVDCFSVDGSILNGYVDDSTMILDTKLAPQDYGIATKKSNTDLADLINETIEQMRKSGELDKLISKWGIK